VREYELTFIVQPEISEEGSATILAKLDGLLESGASKRLLLDDQGKRKLAYPIQKFQKGHYYLLSFLDDGKVVSELERTLRLEESVLRFLSVRVEDDVADVEARVASAREREAELQKRAAEKAAREAEEAKARAEAEAEREAAEAAKEAAEEAKAAEAASEASEEASADADADAAGNDEEAAASEAAPAAEETPETEEVKA
jgi:small subunit ribosomal protein S6